MYLYTFSFSFTFSFSLFFSSYTSFVSTLKRIFYTRQLEPYKVHIHNNTDLRQESSFLSTRKYSEQQIVFLCKSISFKYLPLIELLERSRTFVIVPSYKRRHISISTLLLLRITLMEKIICHRILKVCPTDKYLL